MFTFISLVIPVIDFPHAVLSLRKFLGKLGIFETLKWVIRLVSVVCKLGNELKIVEEILCLSLVFPSCLD